MTTSNCVVSRNNDLIFLNSIKDGNFRQYRGARSKADFVSFVEEKKYEELEPVPAWQDPNSWGMSVISVFYRLSMVLRVSGE